MANTRIKAYSTAKPHIILGMPEIVLGLRSFTIPVGNTKIRNPTACSTSASRIRGLALTEK